MIESQSEKCLAQNESNISVGVHVGSSLMKVKDTHLMNNNQPVAEILCWRLPLHHTHIHAKHNRAEPVKGNGYGFRGIVCWPWQEKSCVIG